MAEPQAFVHIVLTGTRFDQPGMPVEALPELAIYRELLVQVAKALFKLRNPRRQRVPKGFSDFFHLQLRSIGEGSAVPVLERVSPDDSDTLFPQVFDIFTEARDEIERAILDIGTKGAPSSSFPEEALPELMRFGRTLRSGESIQIGRPNSDQGAVYTPARRLEFLRSRGQGHLTEYSVVGVITEISDERSTFTVRAGDDLITCTYQGDLFPTLRASLRGPDAEPIEVTIEGIAVIGPTGLPTQFPLVLQVRPVDEESYEEDRSYEEEDGKPSNGRTLIELVHRVDEIEQLNDGWLDGTGQKVAPEVVRQVRFLLARFAHYRLPIGIYPTENGGIQIEWQVETIDCSLQFTLSTVEFSAVDAANGDEWDELVNPSSERFTKILDGSFAR